MDNTYLISRKGGGKVGTIHKTPTMTTMTVVVIIIGTNHLPPINRRYPLPPIIDHKPLYLLLIGGTNLLSNAAGQLHTACHHLNNSCPATAAANAATATAATAAAAATVAATIAMQPNVFVPPATTLTTTAPAAADAAVQPAAFAPPTNHC